MYWCLVSPQSGSGRLGNGRQTIFTPSVGQLSVGVPLRQLRGHVEIHRRKLATDFLACLFIMVLFLAICTAVFIHLVLFPGLFSNLSVSLQWFCSFQLFG